MPEQPAPVPNQSPAVWDLVIEDMKARDKIGRERYGVPLQAFNGRDPLRDLAEELMDALAYLKQLQIERDQEKGQAIEERNRDRS